MTSKRTKRLSDIIGEQPACDLVSFISRRDGIGRHEAEQRISRVKRRHSIGLGSERCACGDPADMAAYDTDHSVTRFYCAECFDRRDFR